MLERDFQKKVLADLAALPACYFYKAQATSLRGVPDVIGTVGGVFFGLELKREKGKLAPLQRYTLQQIRKAGGIGLVVTPSSWEKVFHVLRKLSREAPRAKDRLQRLTRQWLPHGDDEAS